MGVARLGIFFSSMTASPPSTFFSCAFRVAVVANIAVAVRKERRASSICLASTVFSGSAFTGIVFFWNKR